MRRRRRARSRAARACSASLSVIWSRRLGIAVSQSTRPASSRPSACELLEVRLHRDRGRRAHRLGDVGPGGVEQARRASARPASSAASRARSRSRRCSTYSATFAAGSVIQGPWPGASRSSVELRRPSPASACSRRASRRPPPAGRSSSPCRGSGRRRSRPGRRRSRRGRPRGRASGSLRTARLSRSPAATAQRLGPVGCGRRANA